MCYLIIGDKGGMYYFPLEIFIKMLKTKQNKAEKQQPSFMPLLYARHYAEYITLHIRLNHTEQITDIFRQNNLLG